VITIVCENELEALEYLKLLSRLSNLRFFIRRTVDEEWENFDAEIAKLGLSCRFGFDMIYPFDNVNFEQKREMVVRTLRADDMSEIKTFRIDGGCADCHVKAIQLCFSGKGNTSMRPVGVFCDKKLVCIAMPTLDSVRELKKYDIGAIFLIDKKKNAGAIELIWKYVIDMCIKENSAVGNANAYCDDSPIGVKMCESIGLVKIAKNCEYSK